MAIFVRFFIDKSKCLLEDERKDELIKMSMFLIFKQCLACLVFIHLTNHLNFLLLLLVEIQIRSKMKI